MSDKAQITYAFDAYCGWCYGFGPSVEKFAADNADRVDITVRSGGLFTGSNSKTIGEFPHIPDANARIASLTGVEFGEGYSKVLEDGSFLMDSTDPARGLAALRKQAPERSVDLAVAMQRAWYMDGRGLDDADVYRDIANEFGLDGDQAVADFEDPATREEAEEDIRTVRSLEVPHFPTLLLHTEQGDFNLGSPTATAEELTQELNKHLG